MSEQNPKSPELQNIEAYWTALGRFASQFSQLERQLQLYLMIEAGVDFKLAPAIFSGVKIDAAKSYIKRLRELKGRAEDEFLNRLFAQISIVTTARNDILHYGTSLDAKTGEGTVSAAIMAMPGRQIQFPVSRAILDDLCADLNAIGSGLIDFMMESLPEKPPAEFMGVFRKAAQNPWRYAPPQQGHTRQERQKGAKKQQRPQKPSRG